ncbi:uncharacterized protein LOC129582052 [Paramacrobiotus metropolitanus]|uniref:uncharacterized protein LOC129582052 n=1 Tax=Paramacrobiotus metropolitanus TaxID=2943436 RepID=UPI0024460F4D|nr:uncharacterized protein LOC129582052 [Paramacrobiotus metropolitanus]
METGSKIVTVFISVIICGCFGSTELGGPPPEDLLIPVTYDLPINSSVVSLSRLFPAGTNFSMTSLYYQSRTTYAQPSLAFFLDNQQLTLRSQESLSQYNRGFFKIKIKKYSLLGPDSGIETVDELKVFIVDKNSALKVVAKQNVQILENYKADILHSLESTILYNGQKVNFIAEKVRYTITDGVVDMNQAELCFYVVMPPGFVLPGQEILALLQPTGNSLLQLSYERYNISKIISCIPDPNTSPNYKLDSLSIGLLVLAVALAITLICAIIFICCWIRMKKLQATVTCISTSASTHHPSSPAHIYAMPKVSYYQNGHFAAPPPWPHLSGYPFYDVSLPAKRATLPSSCDVNYEWQESTMDLAVDADSLTQGSILHLAETSSSAPSIAEDTPSRNTLTPSPHSELGSAHVENTTL